MARKLPTTPTFNAVPIPASVKLTCEVPFNNSAVIAAIRTALQIPPEWEQYRNLMVITPNMTCTADGEDMELLGFIATYNGQIIPAPAA